jgi:predicted transcriptional regulator
MTKSTKCDNPMCSCDPCTCGTCRCGVARLGELERRVMDILWEEPGREMAGRDVASLLPENAYTTVATVLDRLVHKGLVHRKMEGRFIRFTAIGSPGAHTAILMHEALAIGGEDRESALVRFAETLSPSEAAVLARTLRGLKQEHREAGRGRS